MLQNQPVILLEVVKAPFIVSTLKVNTLSQELSIFKWSEMGYIGYTPKWYG